MEELESRMSIGTQDRAVQVVRDTRADEAEIRALIDKWSHALEARDLDGLMLNYAPEVLLFDVKPPHEIRGARGYRGMWQATLPFFPKRFECERRELAVTVGGDVAFAHCLNRINPLGEGSRVGETWLRVTVCYRRIAGRWNVVHEHVSLPFDPMTGKAVYITELGPER